MGANSKNGEAYSTTGKCEKTKIGVPERFGGRRGQAMHELEEGGETGAAGEIRKKARNSTDCRSSGNSKTKNPDRKRGGGVRAQNKT